MLNFQEKTIFARKCKEKIFWCKMFTPKNSIAFTEGYKP